MADLEGGEYAEEKRWHAYMCHLSRTWDGVTEPIRYAFPDVPDDFQPGPQDSTAK